MASLPVTTYHPDSALDRADLSPAWFTDLLTCKGLLHGASVSDFKAEAFGTGQLASSIRFSLEYSTPSAGPGSVVGKFPSTDEASRAFGADRGLYETEVRFYRELAANLPISVPTPLHAAIAGDGRFTLILEDLAPAKVVDQLDGATVDQMAVAVEELASLHAATWGRTELAGKKWLRSIVKGFAVVIDQLDALTAGFAAKFGDVVPDDDIEQLRLFCAHREAWHRQLNQVRCLWHQDYRLDNLLYDAKDGAIPLAVVDWQTVGMANGVIDLPYLLGSGLETELRRTHERSLVELYHSVLSANGVGGYDIDECWHDYRALAAHGLAGLAVGATSVQRTPRGDEMWRVWANRHAAQTRDLETFECLARE